MVNYKKSVIYKLCSKDLNVKDFYIGASSCIRTRKATHKSACNREQGKKYNMKVYKFIRENGGFDDWELIWLADAPCENRLQLRGIERKYIEQYRPTLNSCIPGRTRKEYDLFHKSDKMRYSKKYYQENKEKIKEKSKLYYENNKEKCKAVKRAYYIRRKAEKKNNCN